MRATSLAIGVMLLLASAAGTTSATTGKCTIASVAASIKGGGPGGLQLPPLTVANGLDMPVTFDEATGAFSLSRDAWANRFGPAGAGGPTGFGPNDFLIMAAGTISGTIDAAGNVTLPGFDFSFSTDLCPPPKNTYPLTTNLDSGLQFAILGRTPVAIEGTALDFTTGSVTLEGGGVIPAPCSTSPLVSAMTLTCTLNPIPNKAKLPPAPALSRLRGVAKLGKPLPATPSAKPDKGDVLTLGGRLQRGPATFDFTGAFSIRLADANHNVLVFLNVPAGTLTHTGKRFQVSDTNGTMIQVLLGQKSNGPVSSATGGSIRLVPGKKDVRLQVQLQGLDLGGLSGSGTATVAVGPYAMTAPFTVHGGGKTRHLR